MLSDNRVSLVPTPKQMDIENFTLFPPSGVYFPFNKTDCPVKQIYFCVCWKYFGNSLRRSHKIKGEMWQYNKFPYLLSLLVENRLKIVVIVREHGKGHSPLERGQYVLEWVFRYYYYGSVNALASAHGFSPISWKWKKKIAVLYIKHTCTRTINLQDPPVFYQYSKWKSFFFFFFFMHFELQHFMATFCR